MRVEPRPADPAERRALLARLLAQEAERPLKLRASPGQERLWFAMRSAPGSPVYNCPLTIEVRGAIVPEALGAALEALAARHEALRTTFEEEHGELFQVVSPRGRLPLELHLVPGDSLDDRRTAARAYAGRFARAPFDLTRGPLYRVALVMVAPEECLLLLNAHHIVSDGWSQGIVLRELLALYRASLGRETAHLPPLPLRYADVAQWERERELPSETLAFWSDALENVEPLRLPVDLARPPLATTEGARLPLRLSAAACANARAVAEREGASLFQVVLGAFQMLLALWCRQDGVVVGTPAHNRQRAEVEGIVGFFVSTVPIACDFSGDPTLREALDRVRRSALSALSHADVPFDRLVALAGHSRLPGVPPLVQALFVWQQGLLSELDLAGAAVKASEEDTGTSKFDLTVSLRPDGDSIAGHAEFRSDLFGARTVRRLLDRLEPMLAALHLEPETPLRSAPLQLGAAEDVTELLSLSSGPTLRSPRATAEAYAGAVSRCANRTAIWSKSRELTFAELDGAAAALASELRTLGQRDGEPVGLSTGTGVEALVGIVAAWKCASPYVPLDPSWPTDRVERILAETGARLCLGDACGERRSGSIGVGIDLDRLLRPDVPRESEGALAARPSDLAYIIYTSGSTGEPKGVMVTHRNLAHLDAALTSAVHGPGGDRALRIGIFGSLAFDTTVKQIVRLMRGDCLCPVPQELKASPRRLARYLREAALDVLDMTPSWLRILTDAGLEPPLPRVLLLGGEPIDPALWHDLALRQARGEARFVNVYGPTEATVDATWAPLDPDREPSIGRPLPGTRVWLLDEASRPVPSGFVGEIAVAGDGVARGYLGRPEQTAQVFTEVSLLGRGERVYRTGDFGRFRDDGSLVFLGRCDRQVKRHGQRLELGEIEAALHAHPGVAEAAVVEREGRIVAWWAGKDESLAERDLARSAARILPRGFLPEAYHRCHALPRNSSGKIDYPALSAPSAGEPAVDRGGSPLEGEYEEAIAGIWTELLGSPPRDRGTDFFAAGGDSLLGLRLLARIEKRFGVPLDAALLAASPTPESLAAALRGASEASVAPVVWLRQGSPNSVPLALVHPTSGDVACYRPLASLLEGIPIAGLPAPRELPVSLPELASLHARALASAVPGRKVIVGGWSLGGVVALEVARKLREKGVGVPLVLLLDSRLPSKAPPSERLEAAVAAVFGDELVREPLTERLRAAGEKLLELWQQHAPAPYDGDVLLVNAATGGARNDRLRWRGIAPRIAVVECRADHEGMMRPPHVANVARILTRAIHGARRRSRAERES